MTRVILTNQYNEEVCELDRTEDGFYTLPFDAALNLTMFPGDTYKVEEVWSEEGE